MNQEDFRRLLATGGGGGDGARAYGGKRNLTDADLAEIRRLSKKPKKKSKKPASKPSKQEGEEEEAQGPRYRDRAAERRDGVKSGDMVDADQFAHLDTEQSKFLGGDVEHTHLVKGLDFALLAQLKREKEKLQKAAEDAKQQRPGGLGASSVPAKSSKLTFSTRMGRLVYFHACQSDPSTALGNRKAFTKSELFLPGRMDYTFNLSELEMESIPVAVQRSKDDCPEPDDVAHGIVDEELISRIGELLSHQQAGKKLRRKKRDHSGHSGSNHGEAGGEDTDMADEDTSNNGETQAGAAGEESKVEEDDDDDENIFSDVDDYVPVDQRTNDKEPTPEEKAAIKSKGYFSNLSASISASERAEREKDEEAANAWKATLQKAVAAQARKEQEEAQLAKAKRLAAMANSKDEYSEYQAEGAYEDSDDEEGEGGGGDGKKKKKKSSGEEVSETELVRRKQQKQSNKLQNDLEKISKIMDKKEGGR